MKRVEIGLSLGGNLGDRLAMLRRAREAVGALPGTREAAASPVYETEPVGVRDEYRAMPYLNAVVIVTTTLSVADFAAGCRAIEYRLGRVRGADRYAPRTCDIDVLYAGDAVSTDDAQILVPHPRWSERRFVVQPLADVRPDLIVPGETRRVRDILATLPERPAVVLFGAGW